jgi:predicted nucleotidyltransferase
LIAVSEKTPPSHPAGLTGEELLSEVIKTIDEPETTSAIIVHGSWARSTYDLSSDIDLIVMQRFGPTTEEVHSIHNTEVETYRGTLSGLRGCLHTENPLNNNFILNGLHEGKIYLDREGWAGALKKEAEVIWNRGPSAMSAAEIEGSRRALHKMLAGSKRLALRSSDSKENALIAETRSHQVVIQSFYLYHRVRRQWTTSFPLMLRRVESENPALYELWLQYANASSQDERMRIAASFVQIVYA